MHLVSNLHELWIFCLLPIWIKVVPFVENGRKEFRHGQLLVFITLERIFLPLRLLLPHEIFCQISFIFVRSDFFSHHGYLFAFELECLQAGHLGARVRLLHL